MEAHAIALENPFDAARSAFDALVDDLGTSSALEMTHGDLEVMIDERGREVLRQLLQGHLDLRGPGDVGDAVEGDDGVVRTRKRTSTRKLVSIFGAVLVTRVLYGLRGGGGVRSLAPMDASLNLPVESYSHGLRQRMGEFVATGSYDAAVEGVERATKVAVPKRQAEELAVRAAADFDDFYLEREADAPAAGEFVVLTVDGKGIVMRHDALRESTRSKGVRPHPFTFFKNVKGWGLTPSTKFFMPIETTSYRLKPEQRAALLKHLGTPLEPDGPLFAGAPQRAFWWISTNNGRFEGMIMIIDTKGNSLAAYAPQNGRPTVWPASVKDRVGRAVWRSANRLLALSKGEAPDPRFARSLEVKAKLDAERRAQTNPGGAGY